MKNEYILMLNDIFCQNQLKNFSNKLHMFNHCYKFHSFILSLILFHSFLLKNNDLFYKIYMLSYCRIDNNFLFVLKSLLRYMFLMFRLCNIILCNVNNFLIYRFLHIVLNFILYIFHFLI